MNQFRVDTKPAKPAKTFSFFNRGVIIGCGVTSIVAAVVILGLSLWESFGMTGKFHVIEVPGFHELKLETAGVHVGVYQHRGAGPIPAQALSKLDVRVLTKDTYEEVPVLMNNTGQVFSQFGVQGMPLFNFIAQKAGSYTLSAVYTGETPGPTVPVTIYAQSVRNLKQTLIVGITFFALFLGIGIFFLVKQRQWFSTPPKDKK